MPEPTTADVDAARKAVQRYCGWHVAPAVDETLTLDGPGSPLLVLPTLHVENLVALSEDGVEIDVDYLSWSHAGLVRKKVADWWVIAPRNGLWWTANYRGITVEIRHGYDDAEDFDRAVQMVADSMVNRGLGIVEKQVDDVRYRWSDKDTAMTAGYLLEGYRLEKRP